MTTASSDERVISAEETLLSLIAPGTPAEVTAHYLTLAERAKSANFGLLEDEVIVLDTETTGLSFKECELIEISAARLEGNEITERFQTFVNPGMLVPEEISELTGISNKDVADAPSPEEAVAALADFVGGLPVIAHNASFDRTFVERAPGGGGVSDIWIDSLALSRIALPRLKSHKLSDLARAFGCETVTHRADDDVSALCGVWRVLLAALCDLPAGLLSLLSEMHPEIDWPYRPIFAQLALVVGEKPFSLLAVREHLLESDKASVRPDIDERERPLDLLTKAEVAEHFSVDGCAGKMYEHFEARPEQVDMALEVHDAIAHSMHKSIEAGTGVGKSLAYLLPAAFAAHENNFSFGVATKTNALSDQLISHELPALAESLPFDFSYINLKGYEHYLCFMRLEAALAQELPLDRVQTDGRSESAIASDMLNSIALSYSYACQTLDGDLDGIGVRWRYVPRDMLTISSSECVRKRCPYFANGCMVHGSRRRAAASDVVVTNHSLLLRNIDADGAILPPIRHWVIDEAHGFEAEARRQWAVELSGDKARAGFEELGGNKTGLLHRVLTWAITQEASTLLSGLATKAAAASARTQLLSADLFEALHELCALCENSAYDTSLLWIHDNLRTTDEWQEFNEVGTNAQLAFEECGRFVVELASAVGEDSPQLQSDLVRSAEFLKGFADGLKLICEGTDDSYVYYAQLARSKRRIASEFIAAEKLELGPDLYERWLKNMHSTTFTSATIAVGDDFSHFEHSVGLDNFERSERSAKKLDSSFDFDTNMQAVVVSDLPDPASRDYLGALEELLFDIHVAMDGSVLTLFTNRRDMEQIYQKLEPRLSAEGLELLCQEKGSSARRLRDKFIASEKSSLLALKSFWEGFDAAGETLRCVVVPKLPFQSPTDPLVREREKRFDRAWLKYSLPEAVLELKQAAGRLIRTADDSGIFILADPRIVTKSYGKSFVDSLPTKNVSRLEQAHVKRFIEMWRKSHKC